MTLDTQEAQLSHLRDCSVDPSIVSLAPEKIRSGSEDIAGIEQPSFLAKHNDK